MCLHLSLSHSLTVLFILCNDAEVYRGDICNGRPGEFTRRYYLSQILTTLDVSENSSMGTGADGFDRDARSRPGDSSQSDTAHS